MSSRTRWRLGFALLLLIAIIVWRLRPEAIGVEVVAVGSGPLRETIDEDGETRVRDRYVVAAPTAGRLGRVTLRPGDSVRAGAFVAWLDPAPLDPRLRREASAALEAAQDAHRASDATVAAAEAAHQQALRDRVRAESLAAGEHLPPAARESAALAETSRRRDVEVARARAETAAHEVERARAGLLAATGSNAPSRGRTLLHAPVAGRILRILEASERVIPAGTPVVEIGDPTRLEVVADLLSTDAVKVRPGDTVLVEQWGGQETLLARVRMVEPSGFTRVSALGVEEQRVNILADLVAPPTALGDRYRVEVRVVRWGSDRVLKIPLSALVREGERWAVFVVSGGRARFRSITPGHRGAFEVEVPSGLAEGELVLRYPSNLVRDGLRVRITGRV